MTPDRLHALRFRVGDAVDAAARLRASAPPAGPPAVVGRVFGNPTVPTSAGSYASVHPVSVGGAEVEAGPGALTVDTSRTLLVYVVGPRPASAGDDLVCRFVGGRWVADRGGHGATDVVVTPGCPCASSPVTLVMSVSRPELVNFTLQSCTFTYRPTPAPLRPLNLGASCYLSTTTFTDALTGDTFWFRFGCSLGLYVVTRVYAQSLYGTPYQDVVRYRWNPAAPGNSCRPFLLANGQVYTGGDAGCVATVSE